MDRIIYIGLLVFALVMPISIALTDTVWIILLVAWLARMIMTKKGFTRTALDRPVLWLLAITLMSTIMAIDPRHSFTEWRQISLVAILWLLVSNIKDETHLKKILYFFIGGTLLVSVFGIFQYILGINSIDNNVVYNPYPALQNWPASILKHLTLDHGRVIGTRSHPLTLAEGLMMAVTFTFCLAIFTKEKNRRFWLGLITLAISVCLLFTNSRGPWLGTVIGIISLLFFRPSKKALAVVLLAIVVGTGLIFGMAKLTQGKRNSIIDRIEKIKDWRADADSRERVLMWQSGWQMIKDRPLLGIGLGNIHEIYEQYKSPEAWHKGTENELHSNFVQIAVERGILGLGAFLWLLTAFFVLGYQTLKKVAFTNIFYKAVILGAMTSVISFLVAGMTETTYNDSEIITIFYFMVAIVMWIRHKGVKKDESGYGQVAVFMDRDGTISEEVGYVNHPDRFKLLKRSGKAIKMLNDNKIRAIVVTNQAGVGRGYFKEEMIPVVHKKMEDLLAKEGAFLDAVYYCPHHPKDNCECRKPKPGMMLQAKEKFGLDLTKSYVIGDKYSDVEYGHQVGAKSILVLTGYGKGAYEYEKDQWSKGPDYVAGDLYDAVEWIIKQQKK